MNTVKKYMICLLVVALGITIIPAGFQNAEAAKKAETAKKTAPARVKGLKAEASKRRNKYLDTLFLANPNRAAGVCYVG